MRRICFLFLFLIIFVLPFRAEALSIAPSPLLEMNFEPNFSTTKYICVTNEEPGEMTFEMLVEGGLKDYISLEKYYVHTKPKGTPGSSVCMNVNITLPEKLEPPGKHITGIFASYLQENVEGFSVRLKVGTPVIVYVPYPGKYVEASLRIENAEVNKTANFVLDVVNRGNESISEMYARIDIYKANSSRVATLTTERKPLASKKSGTLTAKWFVDVLPGEYSADVRIYYDGNFKRIEKNFMVGEPSIKILEVKAEPVKNGTVGKIHVIVKNLWSEGMDGAYINIDFRKKGGLGRVSSAKSSTFSIRPWEEKDVTVYWDTSAAEGPGTYEGNATIYYLNKTGSMIFEIEVIGGFGETEAPLLLVAAVCAVLVIVVFVAARRRRKRGVQKTLKTI